MILTCPSCSKRFVLPAKLLAPEGRTVKCSACEEEWFQLPDPDELLEDLEHQMEDEQSEGDQEEGEDASASEDDINIEAIREAIEDIPDAVKPLPEKRSVPALKDDKDKKGNATAIGFAAATAVFVIILAGLVFMKDSVVKAWPASAALYQMAGMDITVQGEGLVFDRIQLVKTPGALSVEGLIINLKGQEQELPMIEAMLKNEAGEEISAWYIQPPSPSLEPENTLAFKAAYEGDVSAAQSITLRFVLMEQSADAHAEDVHEDPHEEAPAQEDHHTEGHAPAHH